MNFTCHVKPVNSLSRPGSQEFSQIFKSKFYLKVNALYLIRQAVWIHFYLKFEIIFFLFLLWLLFYLQVFSCPEVYVQRLPFPFILSQKQDSTTEGQPLVKQEHSLRRKHSYNWMLKKKWKPRPPSCKRWNGQKDVQGAWKKQDARCTAVFLWQQLQGLVALGNSLGFGLLSLDSGLKQKSEQNRHLKKINQMTATFKQMEKVYTMLLK